MFKDKTIKTKVMEVISAEIDKQQEFYDSECKSIDEQLEKDKEALKEKAEENKKLMVTTIVKKIVSSLITNN
jgi:uncharacterized membrane protein